MRYRARWLILAVAAVGLVGWSCSSKEDGSSTAAVTMTAPDDGTPGPLRLSLFPEIKYIVTPLPRPAGPHIESLNAKPRDPVMVPEGTTNLALHKPVTSNETFIVVGDLAMITDGEKEFVDGCWVELGPEMKWVQIDLGVPSRIFAIAAWRFYASPYAYHDVVVQVSGDPEFKKNVHTVFNNDYDNSLGFGEGKDLEHVESYEGQVIDAKGIIGRYVRLYSRGNTVSEENQYVEVEVWGKPAK